MFLGLGLCDLVIFGQKLDLGPLGGTRSLAARGRCFSSEVMFLELLKKVRSFGPSMSLSSWSEMERNLFQVTL